MSDNTIPQNLALQSTSRKVVDIAAMNEDQKSTALKITESYDIADPNSPQFFGSTVMRDYNEAISDMMKGIQIKDLGNAGEITLGITKAMDVMKLKKLQEELKPGTLQYFKTRLPIVGKYLSIISYVYEKRQNFEDIADKMERDAMSKIRGMLEYNIRADGLTKNLEKKYYDLAAHIYAGEKILETYQTEFEALKEKAVETQDAMLHNKLHQMHENIIAFDSRLTRMKVAYAKAPIDAHKIRMNQNAARISIQSLKNTLDFTLADLKTTILQVAGLHQIQEAQKIEDKINKLNSEIESMSNTMLADTYIGAKKRQGYSMEQAQALVGIMEKLTALTAEGHRIDQENAQMRAEMETMLLTAQESYKKAVTDSQNSLLENNVAQKSLPKETRQNVDQELDKLMKS